MKTQSKEQDNLQQLTLKYPKFMQNQAFEQKLEYLELMNPKIAVDATGSCGFDTLDILIKEHKCSMSSHNIKDYENINHTFKMRTVLKEAVNTNDDEEMKEIKELFHATQSSHLNTAEKDERWLNIADGNKWLDTFGLRVLARRLGQDIVTFSDKMITITHSGSNILRRPLNVSNKGPFHATD